MSLFRLFRDIRLGIGSIMLHKLRAMLTMLGMVFGVGSVIAMLAVGEGASREALEQIRKLGSQNIIIEAIKPESAEEGRQERSHITIFGLTYDDADRLRTCFPSIRQTVPVKQLQRDGRYRNRSLPLRIVGTTPDWFTLVKRDMIAGRPFTQTDLDRKANVAVITEFVARKLFSAGQGGIGSIVVAEGTAFEVIGIIQSDPTAASGIQTPDRHNDIYIPLSAAIERFGDTTFKSGGGVHMREQVELHQIIVEVDQREQVPATAEAIEAMLQRFHKNPNYQVNVPLALLRQAEITKRNFNIVLGAIAGISLLVGGIGIMNIMLASVTERTREIGIRKAIGARQSYIVAQFLVETVVLSTGGGIIGVGAGMAIPWLITRIAGMPTVVTPFSVLLALGVSSLAGIVFGSYPAARAARLDPIEALRHE